MGLEQAELGGHAEGALALAQARGERELPALAVKAVQRAIHLRRQLDFYAVFLAQPVCQRLLGIANAEPRNGEFTGKFLRAVIQPVQVILTGVEEVAHLIVWHG